MPFYKKKPVTIEAIKYTGGNLKEVLEFTGKHPSWDKWFKSFDEYWNHVKNDNFIFKIKTSEGTMNADAGDWIIKGVKGEFYPCKPVIFEMTYEEIVTIDELKSILGWEKGDDPLNDKIETHSGDWIRQGDVYTFQWSIPLEDR